MERCGRMEAFWKNRLGIVTAVGQAYDLAITLRLVR